MRLMMILVIPAHSALPEGDDFSDICLTKFDEASRPRLSDFMTFHYESQLHNVSSPPQGRSGMARLETYLSQLLRAMNGRTLGSSY